MASYYLNKFENGCRAEVTKGSKTVARIEKMPDGLCSYYLVGRPGRKSAASMTAAFDQIVTSLNRIALCGEDDMAKAAEVLARRNDAVRAEAEELRQLGLNVRVRTTRVRL